MTLRMVVDTDIRDYSENFPVQIALDCDTNRAVIVARNQGGFDCTMVDLNDVLKWATEHISGFCVTDK